MKILIRLTIFIEILILKNQVGSYKNLQFSQKCENHLTLLQTIGYMLSNP
jgi:hypothetical protein